MKQKLLSLAMLATTALSSVAITILPSPILNTGQFSIIPSGTGEVKGLYTSEYIDYPDKLAISIYDENFQLAKSLTLSSSPAYIGFHPGCGAEYGQFEITKGLFSEDFNYVLKTEQGLGVYDLNQTLISTISAPAGYKLYGNIEYLTMAGKKFILVSGESHSGTNVSVIYHIEENSRVNQVAIAPLSNLTPRSPRQGETVTINFDAGDMNEEHQITVCSSDGRILLQQSVPAGESESHFSTSNFPQGIHIVTVSATSGKIASTKIMVR